MVVEWNFDESEAITNSKNADQESCILCCVEWLPPVLHLRLGSDLTRQPAFPDIALIDSRPKPPANTKVVHGIGALSQNRPLLTKGVPKRQVSHKLTFGRQSREGRDLPSVKQTHL